MLVSYEGYVLKKMNMTSVFEYENVFFGVVVCHARQNLITQASWKDEENKNETCHE